MKMFEKKVMRFIFSNRMKNDRVFVGTINSVDYYGNSYFFGRLADNFFDKSKFNKVDLSRIIKDYMINPDDERLVVPNFSINFSITKGNKKLELINFSISYDGDNAIAEVSCNYDYYKLFEKDVAYILDTNGMVCLYDERKSLIGVIAKIVNR